MFLNNNYKQKLLIIKEVAAAITSTDNPEAVANLVLELILGYTKARNGSVLFLNGDNELVIKASKGIQHSLIPTIRIKIGEKICGKVAKEKTPLLVTNIKSDLKTKGKTAGKYKTGSFICCPVIIREKLFGVINITDKIDGSAFTEEDLELIDILSNQTAAALEHADLSSELRLKTLELDDRTRALIDCDRLKGEFIAAMSHKFRTPLNSLAGASYYLKGKKVSEAGQHAFFNIISDETNKLINLLDELLNFSVLEEQEPFLHKKALNIEDTLRELSTSRIIKNILAKNNISIKISCSAAPASIVGEKARIVQAFIYLMDGVAKYASAGDTVELRITSKGDDVDIVLLIKNRKVAESSLLLLFDERSIWADLDAIKERLRFYLAKKIIGLHQGSISAMNAPEGFTIKIVLKADRMEYHNAEIKEISDLFLSFIAETMNLNRCSLMLKDESTGKLTIRSSIGFDEDIIKRTTVKSGDKIAGWVFSEKKPLLIEDIEKHPGIFKKNSSRYNTKSLLCLPIVINKKVKGVLNLNNRASGRPFDMKDYYLATVLTERFSRLIERAQSRDITDPQIKTTLKRLGFLIDAERQCRKKNGKLSGLVFKIMQQMKRSEEEIKQAVYASEFYDLGLTQIDEGILMKSGRLSSIEKKIIRTHPFPGVGLIDCFETDDMVIKAILHHHERYDGSGYPDRLKGHKIPFLSRVLSLADTYSAMTSDRPYRKAFSAKDALKQIKAEAGTGFDPQVVEAFTKII